MMSIHVPKRLILPTSMLLSWSLSRNHMGKFRINVPTAEVKNHLHMSHEFHSTHLFNFECKVEQEKFLIHSYSFIYG